MENGQENCLPNLIRKSDFIRLKVAFENNSNDKVMR